MRVACAAIAAAGLAVAVYLTAAAGAPACFIAHGCTVVQNSAYAKLAGIPVATLGIVGYAAILATLVRDTEATRTAGAGLALTGLGFSGWLTYVEVVKLDAICAWCVVSAVCMALLAGLTVTRFLRPPGSPRSGGSARPRSSSPSGPRGGGTGATA